MLPILDSRISNSNGRWVATCLCGKTSSFSAKSSCLRMLDRGVCSYCRPDYRNVNDGEYNIYRRLDGKWCSNCSGCGIEQAYTRKDHAKQSSLSDWRCKSCTAKDKGFSANTAIGSKQRIYNKFKKSAKSRGILWDVSIEEMYRSFDGKCALTNWDISIEYNQATASFDRINSNQGYILGNLQWVHSMVNMCKNKYDQERFVQMCIAIADKNKC